MKNNVLVDTSIWIEYFNKPNSVVGDVLENLILEDSAAYAGVILAELLQGAKKQGEFNDILENIVVLPYLETTHQTWVSTGTLSYSLRRKGITVPISDLILASLADENDCLIFSLDQHFDSIPTVKKYHY